MLSRLKITTPRRAMAAVLVGWGASVLFPIVAAPLKPLDSASSYQYTGNLVIQSKHVAQDFEPDGDLSDAAWRNAHWVRFNQDATGGPIYEDLVTEVASLWSESNIYFAFRSQFSELNLHEGEDVTKERWELWEKDVVEVYLNPQPERVHHYYEFEIAPNNMWIDLEIDKQKAPFNDAGWNSDFKHATRIDREQGVWTCGIRIPLAGINAPLPAPGAEWRVNFFRSHGLGKDAPRRFVAWSLVPGSETFHVPTRFGILRLVK